MDGKVQQMKYFPFCPSFSDTLHLLGELDLYVKGLD